MMPVYDAHHFDFTGYRMPAEWEPQDAIWLAWPDNPETWPVHLQATRGVFAQMIAALCHHQKVFLLTKDCSADDSVHQHLDPLTFPRENLRLVHIPYNDSWVRDSGPIFITCPGADHPLVAHDFTFNAWGAKYEPYDDDDAIPRHAAQLLRIPCVTHPNFVLEGGSIDLNGQGCLLTTRQCLLNPNRNPHLSQEQIEARLRRFLGVTHILWLDEGIEGDDTDGHVDDITRFVSPTRILTVVEPNRADPNHAPLAANLAKLRSLRDPHGNPFEIIEIPMPDRHVEGPFGRSPASYANFLIANGCVLVPTYSAPNEASVLSTFRHLFPDREIIPIECTPLVAGLGSIHCVTQHQPRTS